MSRFHQRHRAKMRDPEFRGSYEDALLTIAAADLSIARVGARGDRLIWSGDIKRAMREVLALCPKDDYSATALTAVAEKLHINLNDNPRAEVLRDHRGEALPDTS